MKFENSTAPILPKMGNAVHPLMGSGYNEGFKAGQKQSRAEMLAAVLAKMDGPKMSHADLYRAIQKLQPAAEALEELLLKTHAEGHACTSSLQAKEGRMVRLYSCGVHEPIGLEKARAILGDQK